MFTMTDVWVFEAVALCMWIIVTLSLKSKGKQGFMQDNIFASHTCFGGHMDVNC